MELDDRALPLTRGQLDIWLAQETGHSGTEWQLGLFVRIEGTVERDALGAASAYLPVMLPRSPLRRAVGSGKVTGTLSCLRRHGRPFRVVGSPFTPGLPAKTGRGQQPF